MNKLIKYMKKNGYDFCIDKFGNNNYFSSEKAHFVFNVAFVSFEYSDIYEECRKTVEMIEKLTSYCKRYGYTIFSRHGWYGETTFRVATAKDLEFWNFLNGYISASVDACEKAMHLFKNTFSDREMNDYLAGIMDFWESEYLTAVEMMNEEKIAG